MHWKCSANDLVTAIEEFDSSGKNQGILPRRTIVEWLKSFLGVHFNGTQMDMLTQLAGGDNQRNLVHEAGRESVSECRSSISIGCRS